MGKKSYEALESDWLNHFKSNEVPKGRPQGTGWFSKDEMANQAGVNTQVIVRYVAKHKNAYETQRGTVPTGAGNRICRYYRLKVKPTK